MTQFNLLKINLEIDCVAKNLNICITNSLFLLQEMQYQYYVNVLAICCLLKLLKMLKAMSEKLETF